MRLFEQNETEEDDEIKCPVCGKKLKTSSGGGITATYCINCGYDDYDYDL